MRYLLRKENQTEILSRKAFLMDTFHLWFIEKGILDSFIILESVPSTSEKDICIIYGHNNEVATFLKYHRKNIPEKNIFIIACFTNNPKDFIVPGKRVFVAPQEKEDGVKLREGNPFGFEFDISDVELYLFNARIENTYEKLLFAFNRVPSKNKQQKS